jgi:hypothetical protein
MSMPGFTAEAAMRDSGFLFASAGTMDATVKGEVVAPQACVRLGPCNVCLTFSGFPRPRVCFSISCPFGIGFRRCIP